MEIISPGNVSCHLSFNPFMPTGAFNICCPRDCVSRHNGGTAGAPIMPRDAVSRTANVERNGGQKWVELGLVVTNATRVYCTDILFYGYLNWTRVHYVRLITLKTWYIIYYEFAELLDFVSKSYLCLLVFDWYYS